MADLYGELLSNALNRKAPRDHFAAYINPNEAAMLRSQGGGVAPGGGQYMANGMPAFIEDVGAQAWGGSDLDAAPSGWGLGYGGGGGRSSAAQAVIDEARQAKAAAQQVAAVAPAWTGGTLDVLGRENQQVAYEAAAGELNAYRETVPKEKWDFTVLQDLNLKALTLNPDWEAETPKEKAAKLSRPISDYGIGKYSPGVKMAEQDAPAHLIAHVNQQSASGGYAINDPASDVSVPAGYHMGWFPSVMGSLIGMMNPAIGLATALSDFQTLGSRAMRGIREEIPEIGQVADFFATPGRLAGDLVGQGFAPVGRALTAGAQRLGDVLGGVGSDEPPVEDSGALSRSMAGLPEGGFDPPFVPPLPDYAGGFPSLIGSGEIQQGEKEVVGGVSEEMLARLEANAAAARERVREHERRMGMLA